MEKNKIHYYWLDLIKILACFFVVINHTGGYLLEFAGNNNFGNSLFYMINFVFCKMGVPLFIMITGFLLLERNSSFANMSKKIYSKRFSTDCFSDFFDKKALNSKYGINDLKEYGTEKATFDELKEQHSYFITDLTDKQNEDK